MTVHMFIFMFTFKYYQSTEFNIKTQYLKVAKSLKK